MKTWFTIATILLITFIPMVLMFLSGASDGIMDTIAHHWDISIFSTFPDSDLKQWLKGHFFDIDGTWYSWLGFTYAIEDGWHFAKGLMWLFAGLTFFYSMIIAVQAEIVQWAKQEYGRKIYLFLIIYLIMLWMNWWIGKLVFYEWWLLK